jgi:adenosine kinase
MTALICGSLAFDTVMVFPGRFKDHILPDKIHMLNVAFLAPKLTRYFGGCAGNIAYNLKLLGGEGYACGAVGHDFAPYSRWLAENGMSERFVRVLEDEYTAQAYITTDLDDNQITAFHPGAMNRSQDIPIPADAGVSIGILAPDGRDGMITHAEQFVAAGIPFIFDPGQAMPLFSQQDFDRFIDQASWITVNDYEGQLLQERTGLTAERIAERVRAYVVTRGSEGSIVHLPGGKRVEIPPVAAEQVVDPTGCGDAYRAGLLFGLMRNMDWETTGRVASLMGAIKIAQLGTQHHRLAPGEFGERFRAAFGYGLDADA